MIVQIERMCMKKFKKCGATIQARKASANKALLSALLSVFEIYSIALKDDPASELSLQLNIALGRIQDCIDTLNNGAEL